jgi:hypothetical protein
VSPRIQTSRKGIEVVKIAVNLQPNQDAQTRQFIDSFGFEIAIDDRNKEFHSQLFPDYATTTFAVINGVKNSPSHEQWELVDKRDDLGIITEALSALQTAINLVEPGQLRFEQRIKEMAAPVGLSTPWADPDQDGSANIQEYAFGTNPVSKESVSSLKLTTTESGEDGSLLTLSYKESNRLHDKHLVVEKSSDLKHWTEYHPTQEDVQQRKLQESRQFSIRIPINDSNAQLFRLALKNI